MTSLPFHHLANLFPLVEGQEFDDLVTSIRENGQREPIVLLDGTILDGRNRYRACQVAGVEPITTIFHGTDPIRFVMDVNIHRRHLNESQRAMIAAKLATLRRGDIDSQRIEMAKQTDDQRIQRPNMPAADAAKLLNVSIYSVQAAKRVLADGSSEEVEQVEQGRVAVSTIAKEIHAKKSPEERAQRRKVTTISNTGKNPGRIMQIRINADIWSRLRDALTNLTSLPQPIDVAKIARTFDRTGVVDSRLLEAFSWLEGFANAWTSSRNETQS